MKSEELMELGRLSYVPRWVIVPMDRPQTVSDHSFRVALISAALVEGKNWSTGQIGTLMYEALLHDADEILTGDVPATAKYGMVAVTKRYRGPDNLLGFVIKVADTVEAMTWFKMYGAGGHRRTAIAGSMQQTFDGLKNHPHYDHEVYRRAQRIIEMGDME